jgi:hypothetical protein
MRIGLVTYAGTLMGSMIEHRFRELGIDRVAAVGTQSIVLQPLALTGTRMMAVIPERLGRYSAGQAGIRLPAHEAADLLDRVHVEYAAAQRAHPDHVVAWLPSPCRSRLPRSRYSTTRSANSTYAAYRF